MTAALRAEWIKLTTTAASWVLAILAIGIPVVVIGLTGALADERVDGRDLAGVVVGVGVLSAMLLATLAVLSITTEFATSTIRPTFAALPDRWRPLLAKLMLQLTVTLVVMALVVAIVWGVGSALLDGDQSLDERGVSASLVGLVVLAGLLTLAGYALGLLVRSTPLAVVILLLWPLLAEGIIAGLLSAAGWEDSTRWLPYRAGFSLIDLDSGDFDDSLGRIGGGLWFALWVVTLLVLGLWRTHHRDA